MKSDQIAYTAIGAGVGIGVGFATLMLLILLFYEGATQ